MRKYKFGDKVKLIKGLTAPSGSQECYIAYVIGSGYGYHYFIADPVDYAPSLYTYKSYDEAVYSNEVLGMVYEDEIECLVTNPTPSMNLDSLLDTFR